MVKQWQNRPSTATPITAAELNRLENDLAGRPAARILDTAEQTTNLPAGGYGVLGSRAVVDAPPGESGALSTVKVGDSALAQWWQRWTITGAIDWLTRSNSPTKAGFWQRPESPRAVEWVRHQIAALAAHMFGPRADGTTPSSAWSAPAATVPLTIPTPDGTGQATHPSVWDMGAGQTWGSHRYWMVYTPYAYADNALEDPCVAWSDNGAAWTKLHDSSFPLDDAPGGTVYNSDPNLVISNGFAHVIWRAVENNATRLYWRWSSTSATWSAKELIWDGGIVLFSPSLVRQGTGWRMYFVGGAAGSRKVGYSDSALSTPTPASWSAPTWITTALPAGREPWHLEVRQHAGRWWATLTDTVSGQNGVNCRLRLMQSGDGVTWEVAPTELVPALGHTHDSMYKASLVPAGTATAPALELWYSGVDAARAWWIYRTTATLTTPIGHRHQITDVEGLPAELDARLIRSTDQRNITAMLNGADSGTATIWRWGPLVQLRLDFVRFPAASGTYDALTLPVGYRPSHFTYGTTVQRWSSDQVTGVRVNHSSGTVEIRNIAPTATYNLSLLYFASAPFPAAPYIGTPF